MLMLYFLLLHIYTHSN
jgi:hypothetical protein